MKAGTTEHVKFKRLKRRLGLTYWQCVGLLESIWHFTARSHFRGDIGKSENIDIADSIEWGGDEDELIAALLYSGWLDEDENHRLIVHDWDQHCPRYVLGNIRRHGELRTVPKATSSKEVPIGDSSKDAPKPSLAKPSQAKKKSSASGDAVGEHLISKKGRKLSGAMLEGFKAFWGAFNYKKGRAEAIDAWLDINGLTAEVAAEIVKAASIEASNRPKLIADGRTPKMAQGWLSGRRWEDEELSAGSSQEKPKREYLPAELLYDWENLGQFSFKQKHGLAHMDFADGLRVDLVDLKAHDFRKKYRKDAEEVREVIVAFGY